MKKDRKKITLSKRSKKYGMKVIAFFALLVALLILLAVLILRAYNVIVVGAGGELVQLLIPTFLGIVLSALYKACVNLLDSAPWETSLTALITTNKLDKDDFIRVSYATAVIIEVDGKYLLPYNDSFKLYLLPAETYRIDYEEEMNICDKFEARVDDKVVHRESDYSFSVPVTKIKKFYKHFCESIDPEEYDRKPIIDRIVQIVGLDAKLFEKVDIKFVCRDIRRVEKMRYTGVYEMNLMDVCKLKPTIEQREAIRNAMNKTSTAFKFADNSDIEQNGINRKIGKYDADIMTTTYDFVQMISNKKS